MNYPINEKLGVAIETLFDDMSIAKGLLGYGVSRDQRDLSGSIEEEPIARVRRLRGRLESFIVNMANELAELGDDEGPRLRSETTAYLVTLREIQGLFPELDTDAPYK